LCGSVAMARPAGTARMSRAARAVRTAGISIAAQAARITGAAKAAQRGMSSEDMNDCEGSGGSEGIDG
jgi:hypothetical protein